MALASLMKSAGFFLKRGRPHKDTLCEHILKQAVRSLLPAFSVVLSLHEINKGSILWAAFFPGWFFLKKIVEFHFNSSNSADLHPETFY